MKYCVFDESICRTEDFATIDVWIDYQQRWFAETAEAVAYKRLAFKHSIWADSVQELLELWSHDPSVCRVILRGFV